MYEIECIEEDITKLKEILCGSKNNDFSKPYRVTDENIYIKLEKFILDKDKMNQRMKTKIIEAISTKNCLNLFTYIYVLDIKIKDLRFLLD